MTLTIGRAFRLGVRAAERVFKTAERSPGDPRKGPDGFYAQPTESDDRRDARERVNRALFVKHLSYADQHVGDPESFDQAGDYNCGRCAQIDGDRCLLVDVDRVDRAAGSCSDWETMDGGEPAAVTQVKSPEAAAYAVADNGEGWGCKRCPAAEPATPPDVEGRGLYCRKGDFRVPDNACCAMNGAKVAERPIPAARLARDKTSGALGADVGVAPSGDEQSHGTQRNQYPARSPATDPNGQDPNMTDWLWDISDIDHLAPGRADGTYGQEVIG